MFFVRADHSRLNPGMSQRESQDPRTTGTRSWNLTIRDKANVTIRMDSQEQGNDHAFWYLPANLNVLRETI